MFPSYCHDVRKWAVFLHYFPLMKSFELKYGPRFSVERDGDIGVLSLEEDHTFKIEEIFFLAPEKYIASFNVSMAERTLAIVRPGFHLYEKSQTPIFLTSKSPLRLLVSSHGGEIKYPDLEKGFIVGFSGLLRSRVA